MTEAIELETPRRVAFHFDIICPYAFQTAPWIRSVSGETGLEVAWKFFSLEEVNRGEGKKHPWERDWSYGWSMMRIGAMLRRTDPGLLDLWYQKAGHALHVEGRKAHHPDVARILIEEMSLDPALVEDALDDETTHDEVKAEHDAVLATGGWGVPTLIFDDGQSFFGPVVVDPPTGSEAVDLWNLVCLWRKFPHLYEIQRPKRPEDIALIAERFRPYLEARDWVTVQKETP